jgi:hypothetical protein
VYLRDISVYADPVIVTRFPSGFVGWFHRETCCITEAYCSMLRRSVATPDTTKVALTFRDPKESAPKITRSGLGVLEAECPFLFAQYAEGDDVQKKRMVLDEVHLALLWIARERGWDAAGLEECRAEIVRRDFRFEGWMKKGWIGPNPKYRARVGFQFELRRIEFIVGVFDRRGREIGRKHLGWTTPEMGVLHLLNKASCTWNKDNIFQLEFNVSILSIKKRQEADLSDLGN